MLACSPLLLAGKFQIHKRAVDGTVDAPDDGMCLSKHKCDKGAARTMDLKLAKCSHCGAKHWNILGDSTTGYVVLHDEDDAGEGGGGGGGGGIGRVCVSREKGGRKAVTAPCNLDDAASYTSLNLQFASASDITTMSSPGARLVSAATDGDKKAIQALLKEGIDVNFKDWDQMSALLPVSAAGNLDLVKFLVKEGIDVNAHDKDGITALMEASITGHLKVAEFLVDSGAEVDGMSKSGVTPLWLAANQGKTDVMKFLLGKGADPSNTRSDGVSALMTACIGGHTDAIKLLLQSGASQQPSENDAVTPLMNAAESGALDAVKVLVGHLGGSDDKAAVLNLVSQTGFTALIIAAAQGHSAVVEYLLDAGADANLAAENGVNALMYAASNNHVDTIKVLLDKGKTPIDSRHSNQGTALLEACTAGASDAVRYLLERGAEVDFTDSDGVTPLMAVASQAKLEAQTAVLDAVKAKYSGDDLLRHVNLYSHSGGSAVMFAASAGNVEIAKDLLDIGADLSAVARAKPEYLEKIQKAVEDGTYNAEEPHVDGLTGLHVAVQGGHTKMVELILTLPNIDISHKDDLGRTPLLMAIKANYGEIASMLVQAGADPNTPYTDDQGVAHNLLFDSIMVENEKFAKALIEAGADIYHKDEKGVTTLLQACHRGLKDIAQLLVDKHKAAGKDPTYLDAASDEGISPLIAASSEGHLEVVKLLIAAGANVNGKDQDDTTALMAASARGHLDVVKELVAGGAKVNEQNRDGHTALMFAYNGKNQVETLWERFNQFKTEQPDKSSDDGGTGPLIRDALNNHTALVDLLLKNGADTKLKDKEGHVAKDFDYHPDADSEILDKVVKKEASRDESRNEL